MYTLPSVCEVTRKHSRWHSHSRRHDPKNASLTPRLDIQSWFHFFRNKEEVLREFLVMATVFWNGNVSDCASWSTSHTEGKVYISSPELKIKINYKHYSDDVQYTFINSSPVTCWHFLPYILSVHLTSCWSCSRIDMLTLPHCVGEIT